MRDFGVVHTRFWPWAQENQLNDTERVIGLYILTCEHSNSLGCFRLPKAYIAEDLGYGIDRVSKGLISLCEKGFLAYCETTKHVIITKYLKWNPPQNQKHAKGIIKLAHQIPKSSQLIETLIDSLIQYGGTYIKYRVCDTLYHTLCKGYRYTDTDPYTDTDQDTDPDTGAGVEKKTDEIILPDWLDADTWNDFVEFRKKKKSFTKKAASLAISKLTDLRNAGHDPKEVINQTIMNGWTGLFPIRNRSPGKAGWKGNDERNKAAVEGFLNDKR